MTLESLNIPLPTPTTLFTNARLVGRDEGRYSVLIANGHVQTITTGPVSATGATVVDLDGKWLSPVRTSVTQLTPVPHRLAHALYDEHARIEAAKPVQLPQCR